MSRPDGYLVPGYADATRVVDAVAQGFGVTVDAIKGSSRGPRTCMARACAMAVVRQVTGWSYPAIGRFFGVSHVGAMKAIRRVMADPELRREVELTTTEALA